MSATDSNTREIFIVDDDPLVLNALTVVLSREGYQVTGFGEGASFLAAAKTRTPTCIILDVHMPGQSGLDVLKELNAQQYAAPIFIISGVGDIPMAVEAIKNGALRRPW
jgi:two-component system response regulator FixJ